MTGHCLSRSFNAACSIWTTDGKTGTDCWELWECAALLCGDNTWPSTLSNCTKKYHQAESSREGFHFKGQWSLSFLFKNTITSQSLPWSCTAKQQQINLKDCDELVNDHSLVILGLLQQPHNQHVEVVWRTKFWLTYKCTMSWILMKVQGSLFLFSTLKDKDLLMGLI